MSRKPRLVFLVTEYYFFHAMEKDLAPAPARAAFDVYVVAFRGNSAGKEPGPGLTIVDFDWRRSRSLWRAALQFLPELFRVRRVLRDLRPDMLHNIALKPTIGLRFTDAAKTNIEQNIIAPRAIVGIIPEVIDPDYVYIVVATSVKYDPKATTRTKLQLQTAIQDAIVAFAEQNIEKFDAAFRFSKFVRVIDDVDDSILSSLTRLDLEKRIFPTVGSVNQFVLKYGSPLRVVPGTSAVVEATSHRFTYTNDVGLEKEKCFFYESNGLLHVAYRNTSNMIVVHQQNIGTVDVATGIVSITNFAPTAIEGDEVDIRVQVMPVTTDYVPHLNRLYTLDPDEIAIQLVNDTLASGDEQTNFFAGGILP